MNRPYNTAKSIIRGILRLEPSKETIPVLTWRPKVGINFGDQLSAVVVNRLLQQRLNNPDYAVDAVTSKYRSGRRLLAIGSILHNARPGDVVWGAGINGRSIKEKTQFSKIDFRAVRGPLTRQLVTNFGGTCPEIYGDPALLIPGLFPELVEARKSSQAKGAIFIPNLRDEQTRLIGAVPEGIKIVTPNQDWKCIANEIIAAERVFASSLHGIILADAFGVPCVPVRSTGESPFKYIDYLLWMGSDADIPFLSLAKASDLEPLKSVTYDSKALEVAFPLELFI